VRPLVFSFGDRCTHVRPSPLVRLYNNILPPSALPQKANYYLFKARDLSSFRQTAI